MSRRLILLLLSISFCAAGIATWGQAPQGTVPNQATAPSSATVSVAPDEVVLRVGNFSLTAAEFERVGQALPPQFAAALQDAGAEGFLRQYVSMLVLAQEGQRRELEQGEKFEQMVAFDRLFLLSQLAANALAESLKAVTQDDVNYYFSSRKADFEQAKVRAIFIPFETASSGSRAAANPPPVLPTGGTLWQRYTEGQALAKARSIEQRIRAGESMEKIARQESQHPTASEGGDFGYVRRDQFGTRMANSIFALQPSRLSQPVKDASGYYLFMVEQKRIQPMEEVRTLIENTLRQERLSQAIGNLTKNTVIELNPKFFGPAAGGPGQGPR
ncbi:MAG: peptidylprolyl isomerase [Acidobacteria bacterium]|nr:peptidylprolyl isomerase [Acidobacteriota bacterium]